MAPVQIPNLSTLDRRPSWCNLKGNLDRSACIEVRVSEIRKLARCVRIDPHQRDARGRALRHTLDLPNERPARRRFFDKKTGAQRISSGIYTIAAHQVDYLHQLRPPRLLAGDLRTRRANVMRAEPPRPRRPRPRPRLKTRPLQASHHPR